MGRGEHELLGDNKEFFLLCLIEREKQTQEKQSRTSIRYNFYHFFGEKLSLTRIIFKSPKNYKYDCRVKSSPSLARIVFQPRRAAFWSFVFATGIGVKMLTSESGLVIHHYESASSFSSFFSHIQYKNLCVNKYFQLHVTITQLE